MRQWKEGIESLLMLSPMVSFEGIPKNDSESPKTIHSPISPICGGKLGLDVVTARPLALAGGQPVSLSAIPADRLSFLVALSVFLRSPM